MTRFVAGHGGVRLAVYEQGRPDAEVVVLAHGYPDSAAVWAEVAERLAGELRVVRYDSRGAGASDRPARVADYRVDRLAGDLIAVAEQVSPHRPVHLVGHDWGAVAGWPAAAALGPRLASLVSVSGPPLAGYLAWLQASARDPRRWPALADQLIRSWYVGFQQLPVLAPLGLRLAGWRWPFGPDSPTRAADLRDGRSLYRANCRSALGERLPARISAPVLLVLADRDRYLRPDLVQAAARMLSDPQVVHLDSGHWVPLEAPTRLAELILGQVSGASVPAAG